MRYKLYIYYESGYITFSTNEVLALSAYREFQALSLRVGIVTDHLELKEIKLRRISDDRIVDFDIWENGQWAIGE